MMQGNKTNDTDDEGSYTFKVNEHLHYVVLSVLIVFVNIFVILLFAFKRNLRKSPNFLLISLSFSDLLTGLVGLPLVLACSTTPSCIACILSHTLMNFTSTSTVLHILVITYERFIKIVFPFKRQFTDARVEMKAIGILWTVSFLFSLVPLTWSPLSEEACIGQETASEKRKNNVYTILQLIFFVVLPLFLTIVADVSVFVVVRRQLDRIQGTSLANDYNTRDRMKKETKVVAVMAVMMVYFVICWSFYFSVLFIETLAVEEFLLIPLWVARTFEILRCTTSLVNPLIYVLLKHDFRQTLAGELRRLLGMRHRYPPVRNTRYTTNDGAHTSQNQTEGMYLTSMNTAGSR